MTRPFALVAFALTAAACKPPAPAQPPDLTDPAPAPPAEITEPPAPPADEVDWDAEIDEDGDIDGSNDPRDTGERPFREGDAPPQTEGLSATQQARLDDLCIAGSPYKLENFGEVEVIVREGYALEHSTELKIPLWVCEHLHAPDLAGDAKRRSSWFKPDPEIDRGNRAELSDYRHSGYDRGHMAPAADFKFSTEEMRETFYLSNMAPQIGEGFNRGVWKQLETLVRDYAARYGEVWVISGPVFWDASNPTVTYWVLGQREVAVPTHFFKIVVFQDAADFRAVGFFLENRQHPSGAAAQGFQTFVLSIDEIEARTGLDFLKDLPSNVERPLESQVPTISGL